MQIKKTKVARVNSFSELGKINHSWKINNFQEYITERINQSSSLLVHVLSQEHANCDSLPLRYGMYFDADTTITLTNISLTNKPQKMADRISLDANFIDTNGKEQFGHFIIGSRKGYDNPILITVWRNDADTEEHLSDVMRNLRESNWLTPLVLKELHPDYLSGKISSHADLVLLMSRTMSKEQIKKMEEVVAASELKTNQAIAERNQALKKADDLMQVNAAQSATIAAQESTIQIQQKNIQRLEHEKQAALMQNSQVTLSPPDILIDVLEKKIYRGSSCTILVMSNSSNRYMNTSKFDPTGAITEHAKSLIGKRVRISCWDPVGKPGYWSNQGYFRNVYEVNITS